MYQTLFNTIIRASICCSLFSSVNLFSSGNCTAAESREVTENGVVYKETTEELHHPYWETKYEDQTQTVAVPKYVTEYQTMPRQYQVPITEWVAEPIVMNRWNPFATPYVQYQYVQKTRWELRQDSVQVPVFKQTWTNEQRTVKVAKLVQRDRVEKITRKVAVVDMPSATNSNTAIVGNNPASAPTMQNNNQFNQFNNLSPSTDPGANNNLAKRDMPAELPNNYNTGTQITPNTNSVLVPTIPNAPSIPGKFQ